MKILSNTDTGGRVVEFSKSEFDELFILARSCNPQVEDVRQALWQMNYPGDNAPYSEIMEGFDFTHPFEAVRAFYLAQFSVNKIRNLINAIEKSINANVK